MYNFSIPDMQVGTIVATPHKDIDNITPSRKYVIEKIDDNYIWIRNDFNELDVYFSLSFIEADLYFTFCFYSTISSILGTHLSI